MMSWLLKQKRTQTESNAPCYELINALQACRLDVICCSEKPRSGPLLTSLWDLCAGTEDPVFGFPQFEELPVLLLARHPRIFDPGPFTANPAIPPPVLQALLRFQSHDFVKVDPALRDFLLIMGDFDSPVLHADDNLVQGTGEAFKSWAGFMKCAAGLHKAICNFV